MKKPCVFMFGQRATEGLSILHWQSSEASFLLRYLDGQAHFRLLCHIQSYFQVFYILSVYSTRRLSVIVSSLLLLVHTRINTSDKVGATARPIVEANSFRKASYARP